MFQYRIGVLVGSLRRESYNRQLALAMRKLAPPDFEFVDLRIDDLPLYNQDDDADQAEPVKRFKASISSTHAIIFVTPEYNRSLPGVLKNAIDHASRPRGQGAWAGKPAGILGATPGALGTSVAQQHLRPILAYLDMPAMGQPEAFIQVKPEFFDPNGDIANPDTKRFLQGWMDRYSAWVRKLVTI